MGGLHACSRSRRTPPQGEHGTVQEMSVFEFQKEVTIFFECCCDIVILCDCVMVCLCVFLQGFFPGQAQELHPK